MRLYIILYIVTGFGIGYFKLLFFNEIKLTKFDEKKKY